MEMNEALIYLQEALGLSAKARTWPGSARLPLYLRAIEVRAVDANGFSFLLASLPTGVGLPEAKRVYSQLALRAETPVVVSFPDADARQRKALVAQGIPFVCPGRQAFLPFMGTALHGEGQCPVSQSRDQDVTQRAGCRNLGSSPGAISSLRPLSCAWDLGKPRE